MVLGREAGGRAAGAHGALFKEMTEGEIGQGKSKKEKKGTESRLEYSNKSQQVIEKRIVDEMAEKPGGHSGVKVKGRDSVTPGSSQVRSCRSHGNKQFRQHPPRS